MQVLNLAYKKREIIFPMGTRRHARRDDRRGHFAFVCVCGVDAGLRNETTTRGPSVNQHYGLDLKLDSCGRK